MILLRHALILLIHVVLANALQQPRFAPLKATTVGHQRQFIVMQLGGNRWVQAKEKREEEERGSDGRTAAAGAEGAPEGTGRLERRDVAPPTPSFLSRGYRRGESRIRVFWSIFWRERERENTDAKGREKEREKLTS